MAEPSESNNEPFPQQVNCPHCASGIEAQPADRPQVLNCPHCGQAFILPAADGSTLPTAQAPGGQFVIVDEPAQPQADRDDELDGLRIRQISMTRRAAYRSRSYCLIGGLGCVVGTGQLIWSAVAAIRVSGFGAGPALYGVVAILLLALAAFLFIRANQFKREAEQSGMPAPSNPPDFTGLSDGSQRWKDL